MKLIKRRYKLLLKLLDNLSMLSLTNKLALYNAIIKPVWTDGLELWGSIKSSTSYKIQSFQSLILTNHVLNYTIH